MQLTCPRPPRVALALFVLVSAPLLAAAEEKLVVQQGAKASAPVKPNVIKIDLRDLPLAREWEPGDRIKEIPRRHTHLPRYQGPLTEPSAPQEDPLLVAPGVGADHDGRPQPDDELRRPGLHGREPARHGGRRGPEPLHPGDQRQQRRQRHHLQQDRDVLAGPASSSTTLGTGGVCASGLGDPVVLYDPLADRWLLSRVLQLGQQPVRLHLADHQSGQRRLVPLRRSPRPAFPDYPKYGVWPDAYYVGTNESSRPAVYALDRNRMLNGPQRDRASASPRPTWPASASRR